MRFVRSRAGNSKRSDAGGECGMAAIAASDTMSELCLW